MNLDFYNDLATKSLNGDCLSEDTCQAILTDQTIQLLPLLQAAYQVRHHYWQNGVTIHILNNAKNGNCPEDCHYCAQAKTSDADITDYPIKSDTEILEEAKRAYESGAHRYCMVFAGRGPSKGRVKKLSHLIETIKSTYPIQVCLSPGLIDDDDAVQLKSAGLDRLNHNLNTAEDYYNKICTTHTFQDRLNTLKSAQKAGLETCSGMIIGMGETANDVIEVGLKLRSLNSRSIPINFYMEIEGTELSGELDKTDPLTPDYCLRVLSLMRFLNPSAEIRAAAGREIHLRSQQTLALYPANSIFMDGYLNTKGDQDLETLQMIKDAGFDIVADKELDDLLDQAKEKANTALLLKKINDLRPTATTN